MTNDNILKSFSFDDQLAGDTDVLQFFTYFEKNGFHTYKLNISDTESFLDAIKEEARKYYILDSELAEKSEEIGIGKSEFLEQYVLPSVGKIKSGDFGEIFSCSFVKERYAQKGFILVCPRKFIWKMDRDKAMPFTDVVGFYREDIAKASSNDFIVSVESKMKATNSAANRIQEAIDGAQKDRTTRLAKTLIWLKQKYGREGNAKMHEFTKRYSNPVYQGTYNKIYKAFTIVDSKFETTEIENPVNNNDGITIIVISMDNLKNIYENF
ncbi:MAG: SAVED domain-containing protein [Bacteroidales bacterium]|jgi:hypothetical protein|nr:SAVED domain-containing protein [Bacteroidales bacterium]